MSAVLRRARGWRVLGAGLCAGLLALGAGFGSHRAAAPATADGAWLIGFRPGVDAATARETLDAAGLRDAELIEPRLALFRVTPTPGRRDPMPLTLSARHEIAFVERDTTLGTALVATDPEAATQWHLAHIHVPEAWDITQGSERAPIAIVDSGVDPYHPDLKAKLLPGINVVDPKVGSGDQFGHGTKMAGIAAASTNNALGIAGVAGQAPLIPVRVTDRQGRANGAGIAKGIVWAADHGARVINLSLDGVVRSAAVRSAAEYAHAHGALVVVPSGNCGCRMQLPDVPQVLTVAGTDEHDRVATVSTTGSFVDIAAPGTQVPTTVMFGLYQGDSGTSVSSAIVSGVAALMFAVNPELTPDDVRALLMQTAVDPAGVIRQREAGVGRVDALAAVQAARRFVRAPAPPVAERSASATQGGS